MTTGADDAFSTVVLDADFVTGTCRRKLSTYGVSAEDWLRTRAVS
jgi:hypothetical protein